MFDLYGDYERILDKLLEHQEKFMYKTTKTTTTTAPFTISVGLNGALTLKFGDSEFQVSPENVDLLLQMVQNAVKMSKVATTPTK